MPTFMERHRRERKTKFMNIAFSFTSLMIALLDLGGTVLARVFYILRNLYYLIKAV